MDVWNHGSSYQCASGASQSRDGLAKSARKVLEQPEHGNSVMQRVRNLGIFTITSVNRLDLSGWYLSPGGAASVFPVL